MYQNFVPLLFYFLDFVLELKEASCVCHDSVNSKGLFIVRTRLPPRVYSLSPKSSKYKDVHRPSGVTV